MPVTLELRGATNVSKGCQPKVRRRNQSVKMTTEWRFSTEGLQHSFQTWSANLNSVPAGSFALFFGDFLHHGKGLRTAILANSREDGIQQGDGRGVRGAERCRFNGCEEKLVTLTGQGRNIGVRDCDAISSASTRLLGPFDGLSKPA